MKIRKIRFWAERGPALWGSTNRDRRGNKRCTTASRECPRIRFIIGLAHPASSPPPVEKSLGFSLLASRISPRLVRVCGKYTWKEDSFGLPFDSLCSSPPFLKIISDLKSYRVNSSSFRTPGNRERFFSEETSKAKELDGFKLSERMKRGRKKRVAL